ncbi:hypothetical protein [Aquiflexum sp.]|uniref:hypothetical protein n=1 Tax=Aquiflexum sp. TaxID=1872584 RepID=UPI00359344DD
MDIQAKKLKLIEKLIFIKDEKVINLLTSVLDNKKSEPTKKPSAFELLGVLDKEEAETLEKTIESGCENINDEDWK